MKHFFVLSCFVLCHFGLHAQTPTQLSAEQTERLFKAGQLWGNLSYFHPYLLTRNIPFDSAYAAAVPDILAARNDAEYIQALNRWLSVIGDPVTCAIAKESAATSPFHSSFRREGSTGFLSFGGDLSDYELVLQKIKGFEDSLKLINALVLDLRELEQDPQWYLGYSQVDKKLFEGKISVPGILTPAHSGFSPEVGNTSGNYYTYFRQNPSKILSGVRTAPLKIVFICSSQTSLPESFAALHAAGKARILSTGEVVSRSEATLFELMPGVNISFRYSLSTGKSLKADELLPGADSKALEQRALEILNTRWADNNNAQQSIPNLQLVEQKPQYTKNFYPSIGDRAVAAAKIYTVVNSFFPNKKLMSASWDSVSRAILPAIITAKDSVEYSLAIAAWYANIQDGHGFIRNSLVITSLMGGSAFPPVHGNWIEGKVVINRILNDSLAKKAGISIGDIVLARNGVPVAQLMQKIKKHNAYSNESAGNAIGAMNIFRGADAQSATYTIQDKKGKVRDVTLDFNAANRQAFFSNSSGRANTPILRFITPEIGYADLDRMPAAMTDSMFQLFKNTKAIIFDMRGYPQGTAWSIGPYLSGRNGVPAAKFTRLDRHMPPLSSNGEEGSEETWTEFIQYIPNPTPGQMHYKGKTVMLINEATQSQAEHTGLFFRAANGTKFIGSQTAGANGDVTNFNIPGNKNLTFSGQTVWFPDGTQLQRTGLKPDIEVRPSIKGIRAGKDEVLERALRFIEQGK